MVVLIAAVGVSGSGKTTILEFLISHLSKDGYRVGAIKHIHREGFTIDTEGTNTYRFSAAGAKVTVAISPQEIAIIEKTKASLQNLDKVIGLLESEGLDVIFIEGFKGEISKRSDIIKIVTAKAVDDLQKTMGEAVPPVIAISGLVAKTQPAPSPIPYIDLPDDGPRLLLLVKSYLGKPNQ